MIGSLLGGSVPAGKWSEVVLPVSSLGISSGTIPRIAFQGYTSADQGMMYFSEIQWACVQPSQRTVKTSSGMPGWSIALIVLGVIVIFAFVVVIVIIRWRARETVGEEPYRAL
jgi:hypothetical protein